MVMRMEGHQVAEGLYKQDISRLPPGRGFLIGGVQEPGAKTVAASMARSAAILRGSFDPKGTNEGFWMKYGTPKIKGKPFIWSESEWASQKLRDVPDAVDGSYHLIRTDVQ